jgi:UDP-N-acetylglucosamine 1-carboxyvinyltransferase
MSTLIINGPQRLRGAIDINGAKNGVLPLIVCALLTKSEVSLTNVPLLKDVDTMIELLENYGAKIALNRLSKTISIDCNDLNNFHAPLEITSKMRASIWSLAPILARSGKAKIALPGGCAIGDQDSGARQIDMHLSILEQMGANINIENNYINATLKTQLKAVDFCFNKISVGATINAILACCVADGQSSIANCAIEPEISDMCQCLLKMGAKISGIGTRHLTIQGVKELAGAQHQTIPDRIEAGTYLMMAAITKGSVTIKGISKNYLEALCSQLQNIGSTIEYRDNAISLIAPSQILAANISTTPFPGFVTDLQAQFMSLMCLSNGTSLITENIYANRFMHGAELNKMGANITVHNNVAKVVGVPKLFGNKVTASDLRASVCLVLAALAATGTTHISNAYHLERGYENLIGKLANCGIVIENNNLN